MVMRQHVVMNFGGYALDAKVLEFLVLGVPFGYVLCFGVSFRCIGLVLGYPEG